MNAGRYLRKKKAPGLMLTSLLDMFTIILIFLIVSFDTENQEFRLNPDLQLPESSARAPFKPAVNVSVTGNAIFLEEELIAEIDENTGELPALVDALADEYRLRFGDPEEGAPAPDPDDEESGPIVLIQADRELDYRTLYRVLRSAAEAGFFRYRLAVMKI
ncbi:MAG: ExbD/TolR family protein [Sandaracinaceae bacterium]